MENDIRDAKPFANKGGQRVDLAIREQVCGENLVPSGARHGGK
jgi:hypothetical protein